MVVRRRDGRVINHVDDIENQNLGGREGVGGMERSTGMGQKEKVGRYTGSKGGK